MVRVYKSWVSGFAKVRGVEELLNRVCDDAVGLGCRMLCWIWIPTVCRDDAGEHTRPEHTYGHLRFLVLMIETVK
jgi:hypothetical protein